MANEYSIEDEQGTEIIVKIFTVATYKPQRTSKIPKSLKDL